ncbi:uncharacterized protein LOC116030361 [Ipomoea triloba]|uniref:uncharacterized protein LOC116030361 n=1 Tax=Ipomoea triloba TaxID=35885 RepID=UPI00125E78D7|nr:uncharacterized protein LOC116030361 [Ipomoea triloba]
MKMSCRGGADSHHNNNNVREKSFRIRHDDLKLFSRFLSRQETSNRYYGDVSVPFVWESQPGTPKHRFADSAAALRPPLTPPPSYYSNSKFTPAVAPARDKKALRPGSILLRTLLTKVSLRRTKSAASAAPPPPSLSLSPSFSSSSSSLSSFSTTPTRSSFRGRRARRFSGSGSSFDKGVEDIAKAEPSPACCGIINMERSIIAKKVLFSIVGRRQNLN